MNWWDSEIGKQKLRYQLARDRDVQNTKLQYTERMRELQEHCSHHPDWCSESSFHQPGGFVFVCWACDKVLDD